MLVLLVGFWSSQRSGARGHFGENEQTLSDALEDVVDIPGIEVEAEADLSDGTAQRVQKRQRKLDELE